ncbi:putative sorting and assembly machinery component 50-like A-like [Apostichopus japonicus]|uniref:Putative sorting and assembly machinery component 50-like A-like n=1 Tax=Stichopus japonicus TaxID=307972 RepID=A0A2G8KN51_STIJA|nr:putative sorting and assembly machinery component 50-like A-like [Apostichopus japonicus]
MEVASGHNMSGHHHHHKHRREETTFDGSNYVKVEHIKVQGLDKTKNDFVVHQCKDLLKAATFKDVILSCQEVKQKLEQANIFKTVSVLIDTSKGPGVSKDGLDVIFKVKEGRRYSASAHTAIGNNEGSLVLGGKVGNVFGRAERLSLEYSRGSRQSTGYNLTFSKPVFNELSKRLTVQGFKSSGEYLLSSFREIGRGAYVDYTFPGPLGLQSLRWEGVWRELSCLTRASSFPVREQCGHSLKSSLKHIFARDTRDEPVCPSRGYLVKLSQEFAGYTGGDVKFVKGEGELQLNQYLFWDIVFSCSLQGGLMKAMDGNQARINDRFFLGGPTDVRGFNFRGIGPQDSGNFLGAESYWAAGVHLYSPLPFNPGKGRWGDLFRMHAFANAGNLCNVNLDNPNFPDQLRKLQENVRWSYGAGMLLRIGRVARFELNYCIPKAAQPTDSIVSGVQFGVGVSFL